MEIKPATIPKNAPVSEGEPMREYFHRWVLCMCLCGLIVTVYSGCGSLKRSGEVGAGAAGGAAVGSLLGPAGALGGAAVGGAITASATENEALTEGISNIEDRLDERGVPGTPTRQVVYRTSSGPLGIPMWIWIVGLVAWLKGHHLVNWVRRKITLGDAVLKTIAVRR